MEYPQHKSNLKLKRIANSLTLIRSILGLIIIILLTSEKIFIAWVLIIIGAITDSLDGLLARRSLLVNEWGSRLDPLADKLLLLAPIIWLCQQSLLPLWAVWILLARELIVSSWRATHKKGAPASNLGKIKTILQFTSILFMIWPDNLLGESISLLIRQIGYVLFWPSLIIAISSAIEYFNNQSISDQK